MKLRRMIFLAVLPFCLCLTACGGAASSEADSSASIAESSSPDSSKAETSAPEKAEKPEKMGDIHVTIENVQVTKDDLREMGFTVPVHISLESNSGFNYSEWGAQVDKRCTFTADSTEAESLILSEYYSINEKEKFVWNAWASGQDFKKTGDILILYVQVPKRGELGDFYSVTYADWSLADSAHKWTSTSGDWVKDDSVTWTDGGITIIE